MKKIKAILCDFDGTLVDGSYKYSLTTKNLINKIVKKGVRFSLATGRAYYGTIENIVNTLDIKGIHILHGGGLIYDSENKKIESQTANQFVKTIDVFCLDILEDRDTDFDEILNQAKTMEALRISAEFGKKIIVEDIEKEKLKKVVLTSGFFDPLHAGHIELFKLSKELGDKLVVVVNNDEQVFLKRGKKPFMNQEQRKEVIQSIKYVDEVLISIDTKDTTLFETLRLLKPDIFAK